MCFNLTIVSTLIADTKVMIPICFSSVYCGHTHTHIYIYMFSVRLYNVGYFTVFCMKRVLFVKAFSFSIYLFLSCSFIHSLQRVRKKDWQRGEGFGVLERLAVIGLQL